MSVKPDIAQSSTGQNFWSRRRAAVQAEAAQDEAALEAEALAEEHAALEAQSDAEVLAQLDLPDPDTLKEGDDFSVFMAKAVPDRIRRRALRGLWRSNPVLANVDGLVDYGQDFTDSAMAVENIQTAYQVGKGMLKHVEEMARKAAEVEADAQKPEDEEPAQEAVEAEAIVAAEVVLEDAVLPVEPVELVDAAADDEMAATDITPRPRRMVFHMEDTA